MLQRRSTLEGAGQQLQIVVRKVPEYKRKGGRSNSESCKCVWLNQMVFVFRPELRFFFVLLAKVKKLRLSRP